MDFQKTVSVNCPFPYLFCLAVEYYSSVHIYYSLIILSSIDVPLGSFRFLDIMSRAAMSRDEKVSLQYDVDSFVYMPRNGIAGYCGRYPVPLDVFP